MNDPDDAGSKTSCEFQAARQLGLDKRAIGMATNRYITDEYRNANPDWHVTDSAWKAKHVLHLLKKHDQHPSSICEVGCGAGEILNVLHAQLSESVTFVGYDISPNAIELANQRAKNRLDFRLGDLANEPVGPKYDLLLVMDVLEHVENPFEFLRKLKDRARLTVFNIPMDFCVYTAMRPKSLMRGREHMGHIHYFNRETALAILRETGFNVLDEYFASASADGLTRSKTSRLSDALSLSRRVVWRANHGLSVKLFGGAGLLVIAE